MVVAALLLLLQADTPWPRIQVPDPAAGAAIKQALDGASQWLDGPACRAILTEFSDAAGHPLADALKALEMDAQAYLRMIVFYDDSRHRQCAAGDLAFTKPGSRVVHVCGERVKETWRRNPALTIASVIHEALHTLGLGENPPSSKEITARVLARCAR